MLLRGRVKTSRSAFLKQQNLENPAQSACSGFVEAELLDQGSQAGAWEPAKINSLQLSILTAQPCVAENADLISASLAAVISYNNQL